MPIIPYIGVVFPFKESLFLDRYHFYFLMILKETLTFLSLSNPVLQYCPKKSLGMYDDPGSKYAPNKMY